MTKKIDLNFYFSTFFRLQNAPILGIFLLKIVIFLKKIS